MWFAHRQALDFKIAVHAVIHQKTFHKTAALFAAASFLLSLSGISSHQLFLAVYKTLIVYLFGV